MDNNNLPLRHFSSGDLKAIYCHPINFLNTHYTISPQRRCHYCSFMDKATKRLVVWLRATKQLWGRSQIWDDCLPLITRNWKGKIHSLEGAWVPLRVIHLFIILSFIHPSIHSFTHLSIIPSFHPFICSSSHPPIYASIHLHSFIHLASIDWHPAMRQAWCKVLRTKTRTKAKSLLPSSDFPNNIFSMTIKFCSSQIYSLLQILWNRICKSVISLGGVYFNFPDEETKA